MGHLLQPSAGGAGSNVAAIVVTQEHYWQLLWDNAAEGEDYGHY